MSNATKKPVIFLAFANDRDDRVGYLRNLADEARQLQDILERADRLCDVVVKANSTADDIFKVFQNPKYRNRIAVFHYGGHANGYQLLLESSEGQSVAADAGGLAAFFAQQQGLQLVFLNACSTQQQTRGLLAANIPAVISTSRAIDDRVATKFSHQFYQGLASGVNLRTAYNEAEAAVQTGAGGNTRALYIDNKDEAQRLLSGERWPWDLSLREGSEHADQWNLPEAANDPLFGLPPLPEQDLPESPYRYLDWFVREDAEVFFGRGHQIRELYDRLTALRTAPITLFYGQSGVGKSSILDAGVIPRLEQDYEVWYLRRTEAGLLDTLRLAFVQDDSDMQIATAWREREKQSGKPLIVFLDQVEELFTRPIDELPDELDQLLRAVQATFGDAQRRPQGKLVLSFRKEWLAELEKQLVEYQLPRTKVFLERLDRVGIMEIVRGPARSERLCAHYGLTVEKGLPEIIADELLSDRDSAIAPTLQILLTKMWARATEANFEHPNFSQELYQHLRREGVLLRDFLNQQIEKIHKRYPSAVDSGLLLDILALHTTQLGTANHCTAAQLQEQYAHLNATQSDLLQECKDRYLLTVATSTKKGGTKTTRLAHDTLAPLVRERFDQSDRPGQRARRVLESRAHEWKDEKMGSVLDKQDLMIVENGRAGMRGWRPDEVRLIEASRVARRRRRIWRRIGLGLAISAVVAIVLAAVVATKFAYDAQVARLEVEDTYAKSLFGPLSVDQESLSQAELQALWELAETDSERVRTRFIEHALSSPATAERLLNRADMVSVATVGLDQVRREKIIQMITAKLEDPDLRDWHWENIACCVELGHALNEKGDRFKAASKGALISSLHRQPRTPTGLRAQGMLVSAMCGFDGDLDADSSSHVSLVLFIAPSVDVFDSTGYPIAHAQGILDLSSKLTSSDDVGLAIGEMSRMLTGHLGMPVEQRGTMHMDVFAQTLKQLAVRGEAYQSLQLACIALVEGVQDSDAWPLADDDVLRRIAKEVPSSQATEAFTLLADMMRRLAVTDPNRFRKLDAMAQALSIVAGDLGGNDIGLTAYETALKDNAANGTLDDFSIITGVATLAAVRDGLPPDLALELLPLFLKANAQASEPRLARSAAIVATKCLFDDWSTAVKQGLSYQSRDNLFLSVEFMREYDALNSPPVAPEANKALHLIRSAWTLAAWSLGADDSQPEKQQADRCRVVAQLLAELSGEFSQAEEFYTVARKKSRQTTGRVAWIWARCCNALAPKTREEFASRQIAIMIEELQENESSEDSSVWSLKDLTTLSQRIGPEDAVDVIGPISTALVRHLRSDLDNEQLDQPVGLRAPALIEFGLLEFAQLHAKLPGELSEQDADVYMMGLEAAMSNEYPQSGHSRARAADSLVLLDAKLPKDSRQPMGHRLEQMIMSKHDQLAQFVRALAVVWRDMGSPNRKSALNAILTSVSRPALSDTLHSAELGRALTGLAPKLSADEAERAFVAITIGVARTDEPTSHEEFERCLAVLVEMLDVEQLVAILHYPTCVGKTRQLILDRPEINALGDRGLSSQASRQPPKLTPFLR